MSCVTVPTLTTTQVQTSQETQTIVTSSVSTAAPTTTVITSLSTSCPAPAGSSATATCTPSVRTISITTVIPGSTTTIDVTQTSVVQVTNTVLGTQFSTSCAAGETPSQNTPTTVQSTESTSTSTSTSTRTTSTSTSTSTSTTPSTTSTQTSTITSTSTAPDGNLVTLTETSTFALTPTSTSSAGADGGSNTSSNHVSSSKLGAIIGGSVGGVLGLAAIVFIIWFLLKRRRRWDDIFEREEDPIVFPVPKRDPPPEVKPKPYEYGLVGHAPVPPPHMSPPSSDSGAPTTVYSDAGQPQRPPEPFQQQQQVGHGQGQTHGRLISVSSTAAGHRPSTQSSVGSGAYDAVQGLGGPIPIPVHNIPNNTRGAVPGGARYPPGIQRNVSALQGRQPGSSSSVVGGVEPDAYGVIDAESSVAGLSAAASVSTHSRSNPSVSASTAVGHHAPPLPAAGPSAGFDEYDPYQEALQQQRERRDGKGRLITTGEKRPVVHLDGGRYRDPAAATTAGTSSSLGNAHAPPAYSA